MNYLVRSGAGGGTRCSGGVTLRNDVVTVGIVLVRNVAGHGTISLESTLWCASHTALRAVTWLAVRTIAIAITLDLEQDPVQQGRGQEHHRDQ